jgi:hypothetical protein
MLAVLAKTPKGKRNPIAAMAKVRVKALLGWRIEIPCWAGVLGLSSKNFVIYREVPLSLCAI